MPLEVLEEAIGRGADGGPDLRPHRGRLAGDDAVAAGGASASSARPGRPLLTTHLRIQDGEILVQGPVVAPGCADEDGWLHTGDLGRIDDEGFLYVEDRLGDVIVSGGENVLPAEVEEVLLRHPDVADAAAVGRADAEWQEAVDGRGRPAATAPRRAPTELRRHCAESLAGYKVPKRFEFVSELPRTASGKLLRRALR